MKRIEAIIRPHKQTAVLAALARAGHTNVTVLETMGLVRQVSFSRTYEVVSSDPATGTGLIPKRLFLMFVPDDQVESVVKLIQSIAFTGEPGDGVIGITALDQCIQIRSQADSGRAA